uniref:Mitochondrial intermembrane space import and assembly protein 40 n=1 Tax=Phascolarctos cinereus TaxID=38626 RepID=A0A6P5JXX1_PHACI|nr:mitochondrial intermembrane space import and assembly protein 40 [Phascolarctos cinereus]
MLGGGCLRVPPPGPSAWPGLRPSGTCSFLGLEELGKVGRRAPGWPAGLRERPGWCAAGQVLGRGAEPEERSRRLVATARPERRAWGAGRSRSYGSRRASAMSYCRQEGKDRIIFVTKEDHETPSNAELVADDPNDPYEDHGLILPNGDINWNCPCLGGMASGPCGEQFKSAFSCFHYSTEEVKGSDCVDQFRAMQECMQKYPDLYPQEEDEEEKTSEGVEGAEAAAMTAEAALTKEEASS